MKAAGFEIITAKNADEGVSQAEKFMPALVLMDIYMPPGASGTDAALRIKQNPKTKDIKIAFLTSLNDPWPQVKGGNLEVAKGLGMEGFIKKEDDLNLIIDKVKRILGDKAR